MKNIAFLIPLLIVASMVSCSQGTPITGEDRKAVLDYAEPITENMLSGFNAGNYETYSRDFDEMMKSSLNSAVFKQTRDMIVGTIGKYKSRTLETVLKKDRFIIVIYKGDFEKESDVAVKVVFANYLDRHHISGLWFDSPKLRQ